MNIQGELSRIWQKEYMKDLPSFIKERGYCYSINTTQKDLLITGINPSFRIDVDDYNSFGFDINNAVSDTKYDNYWGPIRKMLYNENKNIDLRPRTAYIDLFYFREMNQEVLKRQILSNTQGIKFLVDQLNLTQHIIEDIVKPKVVIVKNRESAAYWGRLGNKGIVWMGYDLVPIDKDLFKINGLLDSPERIAPEIIRSNIEGSIVYFTNHIGRYTKAENRPTVDYINSLLERESV